LRKAQEEGSSDDFEGLLLLGQQIWDEILKFAANLLPGAPYTQSCNDRKAQDSNWVLGGSQECVL